MPMVDLSWSLVLTTVFAFLVAIVGILTLGKDFRDKRRWLTRQGWGVVVLLLVLAALTVGSAAYDERRQHLAAVQAASERAAQFDAQMDRLAGVADSLTGLQQDLVRSERGQRLLLERAEDSLSQGEALDRSLQRAASGLAQRIFVHSNNVDPRDIAFQAALQCDQSPNGLTPRVEAYAETISVASPGGAQPVVLHRDGAAGTPWPGHGFRGDLGRLSVLEGWRGARVTFHVRAERSRIMTLWELRQIAELGEAANTPCRLEGRLLVNGRLLTRSEGVLMPVADGYEVSLPASEIDESSLPRPPL